MNRDTDNLPMGGTESAHTSDADTSPTWDYYDPDEDQDTVEAPVEGEIESGEETDQTVEASDEEAGQSDEAAEDPAKPSDEPAAAVKDDIKVPMPDGSELTLAELRNGYLRQSDYTRKTTEAAELKRTVEAQASRIERTVNTFAEFLASRIPPAPDYNLSVTDPGRFVREKAAHEAAVAQVAQILEMGGEAKAATSQLSQVDQQKAIERENAALLSAFPETAKPEGRKAFFGAAVETAKALGYSDEEIKGVIDHRLFALSYWASKGMAASKAAEQAKAKVQNVPPVTAAPKRPAVTAKAQQNRDAMKRLSRTGSIKDALAIDFD